ncbi:hypothetical protein EN817_17665 [Mesorhizobium sp. M3A.F.Ca.ET.174.01.1.1]|uniref:LPD38 domain-containing protein n=1 Tax=unclassified Mesorhizobium TaxID=325217 RepID=UPI001093B0FA|nr:MULTISPECIES: LPD38 domain-containing protein [unclassified Mesorhizobium]TGS86730.1 hypothetical protein EN818_15520 [Mesorhizobium sp. M3A.F.Ca.ET.175.01.1.1]TGT25178.1 hypothetical protein EN817_17665 [Mesorhizobium sp. M3A.F.Ca.ET.174.01.1.1]
MADNNPFDALDSFDDGPDQVLQPAPPPGLVERFKLNFEGGQRYNTILGAINDAQTERNRRDRARFDAEYESFPQWSGFLEGSSALAGSVAGTAASPENFIPIGLGEKVLVGTKAAVTGLWAKIFSGAIDSAAANAVSDAAIQGVELGAGNRDSFDPWRYASGVLLGFGIGGLGGSISHGLEVRSKGKATTELFDAAAKEKAASQPGANPFDGLDDAPPAPASEPGKIVTGKEAQAASAPPVPEKPEQGPAPKSKKSKAPAAAQAAPVTERPEAATLGDDLSAKAGEARDVPPAPPPAAAATPDEILSGAGHDLKKVEAAGHNVDEVMASASSENVGRAVQVQEIASLQDRVTELEQLQPLQNGYGPGLLRNDKAAPDEMVYELGMGAMTKPELDAELAKTKDRLTALEGGLAKGEVDQRIAASVELGRAGQAKRQASHEKDLAEVNSFMATPVQTGALRGQLQRPAGGSAATSKAVTNIARVRETAEALAVALDVAATRQGRLPRAKGGKVLGVFKSPSGVVRVKSLDDFDVLTHEYGHHVEKNIPGMTALMKAHAVELRKLDYDPAAGRPTEGFAEFFRLWLTNRPFAQKEAPGFAKSFEALLATHPEISGAIDKASKAWSDFLSAPSTAAVASTIVSAKRKGWVGKTSGELKKHGVAGTIHDVLQRIYTFAFDDLNPLARAVKELQAVHIANKGKPLDINVSSDAYKLARMSRGAYSAGHMDVMYGVAPYRGTHPESPSLRDAIVEATGKPNALSGWDADKVRDFGSYLWSRRALAEWERFRAGEIPNPPDKLTHGDHLQNVAELAKANPAFVSAADKVHEFGHALWKKKFDAGLIDQVTYEEGLKIVDYVPGLRDFSSDTDAKVPGGPSRGKTAKGGFASRFRGSKRDVINPLESMAADAYETAMAIARNDVVKALDRLALTAGQGAGAIAERIPAKEMKATMVDPLEAVETAARNAGLAKPDIMMLRDSVESAIGDEKAAIFRPAIINEKGEPIVFFRDGGKLQALRLADGKFGKAMYGTLAAMSQHERNFWLELVAVPARILRMGITTAFEFVGANFVRDQAMAAILYGKPLQRLGRSLQGAADDLLGSETARLYSRVGGLSGGQETASLSKVMAERDLAGLRRKGWVANRLSSWHGILAVAEVSETATRLGLFRTFAQEAKARGLSDMEAALEASWRARDYLDFDRRGSGMAALARVIPFFNVALQGTDKVTRHMIAPIAKKMLGQALSPEDTRALGAAAKSWAYLAALTVGSMSLYALQSRNEDHDEISAQTKATHWMIKSGGRWVAVPKPFELATVINLAEASYDAMVKKDPSAGGRWVDSLFSTLAPPSILEGNPAITSYFEVKTNTDFFTGAPIVPEQLQGLEPFLQYTARTSELSKELGKAFNISPAIADHLITAHLGSWGRSALSLYDLAQPDAPGFAWDDAPISRRFIKDAAKGSQSVTMFWQTVGERQGTLEGKAKSWRSMIESGDPAGAADYYASQDDIAKVYIGMSAMDAKARRLHPLLRARGAIEAIGAIRRDLAMNRLTDGQGNPLEVGSAARTAADDILSTLSMAMARNALALAGVPGWAQRQEIPEDGFYRELEAVSPDLAQRLADGFATNKVWTYEAVKEAWPDLRQRVLEEGSQAQVLDLVGEVQSAGNPIEGGAKIKRKQKPALVP